MTMEHRGINTLTDAELAELDRNPATSEDVRDLVAVEMALRHKRRTDAALPQRVTIVAVDIPFGDMISLMVKWSFAAVPAMIVVALIWLFVAAFLAALGAKR